MCPSLHTAIQRSLLLTVGILLRNGLQILVVNLRRRPENTAGLNAGKWELLAWMRYSFLFEKKPKQIILFSVMNQQRSDADPDPALIDHFYVWRIRTSKSLKAFQFPIKYLCNQQRI